MTLAFKNNLATKFLWVFFITFIFLLPLVSLAQNTEQDAREIEREGLVNCGKDVNGDGSITADEVCKFTDLFDLIRRIITFGLFVLALPLAVISIAVAGWKFIVAGDNSGEREKAKEILINVVIGLILAFAAWIIVDTIVDALVETETVNDEQGFESPTNQ